MQISAEEIRSHAIRIHAAIGAAATKKELTAPELQGLSESALLLIAGALTDLNRAATALVHIADVADVVADRLDSIAQILSVRPRP